VLIEKDKTGARLVRVLITKGSAISLTWTFLEKQVGQRTTKKTTGEQDLKQVNTRVSSLHLKTEDLLNK